MSGPVYLDFNATAPIRPEAAQAAARALQIGANPSSVHAAGRAARAVLEAARLDVAALAGAPAAGVTFTSGGAEANALAISSAIADGCERILLSTTEHDTVRAAARAAGGVVSEWPVDANGLADLEWLEDALAAGGRPLVCLMAANNETGVIQPVAEAARLVHAAGGWLHVDAVQAAGKTAIDIADLGADTLSLSAHKLGGPQGSGALVALDPARLSPRQLGGGQERGLRAGTENLSGIAGFGAAARAALADLPRLAYDRQGRDALQARASRAGAQVLGLAAPRLPQTLCIALAGWPSELQVIALDLAGVMVSAGAACSSGKVRASHVVAAMGRPDLAPFAIRISGGWRTSHEDWVRCADAWTALAERRAARALETA